MHQYMVSQAKDQIVPDVEQPPIACPRMRIKVMNCLNSANAGAPQKPQQDRIPNMRGVEVNNIRLELDDGAIDSPQRSHIKTGPLQASATHCNNGADFNLWRITIQRSAEYGQNSHTSR